MVGVKVESVSVVTLGVTNLLSETVTVAANVLVDKLATPGVTWTGVKMVGTNVVRVRLAVSGVATLVLPVTLGAKVVRVSEATPGVTSLLSDSETVGAKVEIDRDKAPGVTDILSDANTVGASPVTVKVAVSGVAIVLTTTDGAKVAVDNARVSGVVVTLAVVDTVGAKVLVVSVANPGVTVLLSVVVTVGAKVEVVSVAMDGVTDLLSLTDTVGAKVDVDRLAVDGTYPIPIAGAKVDVVRLATPGVTDTLDAAALISSAIIANSPPGLQVKSTLVSLSLLNSLVTWTPFAAPSASAIFVNPLPGVTVTPRLPTAIAPYVALFALENAASVADKLVPPAVLVFDAVCTIAPEPLVPEVSAPVNSSITQATSV